MMGQVEADNGYWRLAFCFTNFDYLTASKPQSMALQDFRAIYFPYCLRRQESGTYLVLNREYMPLSFNKKDQFIPDDYPIATRFRVTKALANTNERKHGSERSRREGQLTRRTALLV